MAFFDAFGPSYFGGERELLLQPHAIVAEVKFKNLIPERTFYKTQYRSRGKTMQLVCKEDSIIEMEAITDGQLIKIVGWVRREESAARKMNDDNGEVPIRNEETNEVLNLLSNLNPPTPCAHRNAVSQPFSVNLHPIYKGHNPNKPVFELSRNDKDRSLNLFQLIIQLEFIDGSRSEKFFSPAFRLQTKPGIKQAPSPSRPKRPRSNSSSPDIVISVPNGVTDGSFENREGFRHSRMLVDQLDAKTANVDQIVTKKLQVTGGFHAETPHADMAYYLMLKDPTQYRELEEGDIVGFYNDDETGQTYMQRLRADNINSAIHAGVISRSHWLAGHKPANPDVKSDTVCVIGIVPVKVAGSIDNGERIYASVDRPGKAIPQTHMPVGPLLRKKHVLLGMALEKKHCKQLDAVNLVKCFVCVVLDASRKELLEEIEDLYENTENYTEKQIKLASKRTWRKIKGCTLSALLMLAVIIFLLYQWLVPGSMFRYWLCRRGSIPGHHLRFSFNTENPRRVFHVHGIEFTWSDLQDKVGFKFKMNYEGNLTVPYYLNIDRCAYYWDHGALGNNIGGRKFIGGSRVLTVNKNCSIVYELDEGKKKWEYVHNQKDVICIPPLRNG